MKLLPNQTETLIVKANEHHTTLHLDVVAGEKYTFACDPEDMWVDVVVVTNADGFDPGHRFPKLLFPDPVVPNTNYMCLCGRIDPPNGEAKQFAIGVHKENFAMPASGQLSFFANDAPKAYWNNLGKIAVRVTRVG